MTGIGWYIKEGHSSPTRTVNLLGLGTDDIAPGKRLSMAVLAIQPTPEGKVLIAHRDKEGVLESRKAFDDTWRDPITDSERERVRGEREAAARVFPRLIWTEIDPELGTRSEVFPPHVPSALPSPKVMGSFFFMYKPDKSIYFYPKSNTPTPKPPEKAPTEAPKSQDPHR